MLTRADHASRGIAAVAALALLGACQLSLTLNTSPESNAFSRIDSDARAMAAPYVDLGTGSLLPGVMPTPAANLPASGSAAYRGFLSGDIAGDTLVGDLSLVTAFGSPGSVAGWARDFQHERTGTYGGTLIVSGTLSPAAIPQIVATASGTLENRGTSFPTSIALRGSHLGAAYGAVAGSAIGNVGASTFTGGFVGER